MLLWFRCVCSALLAYTNLVVEWKWFVASGEEGKSHRVCENAEAPASFKTDKWGHFGFLSEKWDRRKADGVAVLSAAAMKKHPSSWERACKDGCLKRT